LSANSRNPNQVQAEALEWHNTLTISGKKFLEGQNGVHWTPLHLLPYWDPVNHLVLGFMHNWLEGILVEHLRTYWGIGQDFKLQCRLDAEEIGNYQDERIIDSDASESMAELEDLEQEASNTADMDFPPPSQSPTPSIATVTPADFYDSDTDDDDYVDIPSTAHKFDKFVEVGVNQRRE
jgi:hypothetical protein